MRLDFPYYSTVMIFDAELYFEVAEGARAKNILLEGFSR